MATWTKRQFIDEAFSELALAVYVFDLRPEEQQKALRRLDSMVQMWEGKGITLGFPLHDDPADSDLDEVCDVFDKAVEPIFTNLAVRIAPAFGKTPPPELKAIASEGYEMLLADAAFPVEQVLRGNMPLGAGNRYWLNSQFTDGDPDPLDTLLG